MLLEFHNTSDYKNTCIHKLVNYSYDWRQSIWPQPFLLNYVHSKSLLPLERITITASQLASFLQRILGKFIRMKVKGYEWFESMFESFAVQYSTTQAIITSPFKITTRQFNNRMISSSTSFLVCLTTVFTKTLRRAFGQCRRSNQETGLVVSGGILRELEWSTLKCHLVEMFSVEPAEETFLRFFLGTSLSASFSKCFSSTSTSRRASTPSTTSTWGCWPKPTSSPFLPSRSRRLEPSSWRPWLRTTRTRWPKRSSRTAWSGGQASTSSKSTVAVSQFSPRSGSCAKNKHSSLNQLLQAFTSQSNKLMVKG